MGTIKINNIVYGSNNASEIIYKSQTVEEKLDTIPIFDINDNGNVDNDNSNNLTYGHIINALNSDAEDKVLSAKQGKVLKNSIDNIDLSYLEDGINNISEELNNFRNTFLNLVYPIGAVYLSLSSTNPGTLFGGIWEQLKDRFLLGAGSSYSVGSTGGAATHTLTINEMPKHGHGIMADSTTPSTDSNATYVLTDHKSVSEIGTSYRDLNYFNSTGGGAAHNNMPPYLTVYMWKRVS